MGLAEQRLLTAIETESLTETASELKAKGITVAITIDAPSFGTNMKALEEVRSRALPYISRALVSIASDDLGKQAVAKAIKQVRITQAKTKEIRSCTIAKGSLVVSCQWDQDTRLDENEIRKQVENQL